MALRMAGRNSIRTSLECESRPLPLLGNDGGGLWRVHLAVQSRGVWPTSWLCFYQPIRRQYSSCIKLFSKRDY
jgi:hypothetical protein